jgi:hypothetical protein
MTDLKIATAVRVIAGIIVNFIDRWYTPHPRWLGWLAWFLASVPAILYIALDYLQQARKFP